MIMILNKNNLQKLGKLRPGDRAEIAGFCTEDDLQHFLHRLYEVGFLLGEHLEVLQEAPFSSDPMSIKIKDAVYALRREEANLIQVHLL
jgi:ferrous iron transport protein A